MNAKKQEVLNVFKDFKIVEKGLLWKVLFKIQKKMAGIIIGNNVFLNNNGGNKKLFFILFHEEVHRLKKEKIGTVKFYIQYFIPQIFIALSLFSLLAIPFSLRFLHFLLFLLFVYPLKAKYRTTFEEEAYSCSIALKEELGYEVHYERYVKLFHSWGYWKMDKSYQLGMLKLSVADVKERRISFIKAYANKYRKIFSIVFDA